MSEPATATAPASELEINPATAHGKAFVIKEFSYGNSKVTLLGKEVTKKDGTTFTKRFFAVEHFYRDEKTEKWESNHYFDDHQISQLLLAIQDARRGLHDKSL